MTLASMARVLRSMSSLMGMFEWNLGPSSANGISIALMWHSTTPLPTSQQMLVSLQRATQVDC